MSAWPYRVTAERARYALGYAYVKGEVNDPLPPLDAREVRALVTRIVTDWGPDEMIWWDRRLRVWPSERDRRTHEQVAEDVEAWAEARVRRYISHYRPKDPDRHLFTVNIDPDWYEKNR